MTKQTFNSSYMMMQWDLTEDGDGRSLASGMFSDKTVQVVGSFGGGTVTIEGSMNGDDWVTLNDPQGDSLTFTTEGMAVIAENPQFVRPSLDGSTDPDLEVFVGARAVA